MRQMKFSPLSMMVGLFSLIVISSNAYSASVARVNGVAIPQSRMDLMVKANVAQGQKDSPEMRKALRENLIAEEIMAQEAKKKGLDRTADVKAQIELSRQAVLVRAYQADYIKKNKVSDETLRKEYEMLKLQMGNKEYKARHILVENENEAKSIIANLKRRPADFNKIASQKSKDEGSKAKGGELGWSPSAAYVRPFSEALMKLKKGGMTDAPIKTAFGWHVIKLDDVRPMKVPPFEEVKQNIQQRILQREFAATVQELRSKAKVE